MKINSNLFDCLLPIVAAPMAGGPTTVALAQAVSGVGGFPFLAGGYKSVEALATEIAVLRASGGNFGVNLFVPSPDMVDAEAFRIYAAKLQSEALPYGLRLDPLPVMGDDDGWPDKLALLLNDPVPVVSFTFVLPAVRDIAALRCAGSRVLASVTLPAEAQAAMEAGVDGLVVQGPDAGGHSATYDPGRPFTPLKTVSLVRRVCAVSSLPVIAAGGVDGPVMVRALLQAGAAAVAIGTLLLRTKESGATQVHKDALANPAYTETVITHAFTGRPARTLRNGFVNRYHASAPLGYPAIHHLTRPLRQAAASAGDADVLHLWTGTGYRQAMDGSAVDVIQYLAAGL